MNSLVLSGFVRGIRDTVTKNGYAIRELTVLEQEHGATPDKSHLVKVLGEKRINENHVTVGSYVELQCNVRSYQFVTRDGQERSNCDINVWRISTLEMPRAGGTVSSAPPPAQKKLEYAAPHAAFDPEDDIPF